MFAAMKPSQLSTLAQWNNGACCRVGSMDSHGGAGDRYLKNLTVGCCVGARRGTPTQLFSRIMGEFCGHVGKGRQYARLFKHR